MTADAYSKGYRSIIGMKVTFLWLLMLCATSGIVVLLEGFRGHGYYPFLQFRHFVVGALILLVLFSRFGKELANAAERGRFIFLPTASISFGLYVFHYPLLVQSELSRSLPGFITAVVVLLLLSWVVEHHLTKRLPKPVSS